MPVGFSSGTCGGSFGNGMMTFVYWGCPKPCIVKFPGTSIGVHPPLLNSSVVTDSGRALILKSHSPFRLRNQGDFSRSKVSATAAVGYGIKVARAGSLLKLDS